MAAPLVQLVGQGWARGEFEVYEEHLFTEQLTVVLRSALGKMGWAASGAAAGQAPEGAQATLRPRVLLTTLPQESHGLGLLMVEAMMSVAGMGGLSLGVQTPPADIVKAVRAQGADIVALSFSSTQLPRAVAAGLRALLPAWVQIWAGGGGLARVPRLPEGG